jgi:IS1 family transposase
LKKAYEPTINSSTTAFVKEGCGIRSIARLLHISPNTVLGRIKAIASAIIKPVVTIGRTYEVDELKTYVANKSNECRVIYALDKQTGQVVDFKAGRRTKANLKGVTDTLLLANSKRVYTDGLKLYRELIPQIVHRVRPYDTNKIERKNLCLRTHQKRLNRKLFVFQKA